MKGRAIRLIGLIGFWLALLTVSPVMAGPVVSADYRLPAKLDPDIASDVETEIWATVWRPAVLAAAPYPVVVFLHGNHGTCGRFDEGLGIRIDDRVDYTFTGKCPGGYTVTPSHRGYGYVAERLAAVGYIVVSINANRGVNAADGVDGDFGLNLRRGRLVLKHLELLAGWNRRGGAPASLGFDMRGKLDLAHVGLVGHSRGGEGMRAAMALYNDAGSPWKARLGAVGFRALYEIGPVDGQTSRTLNALGVAWHVLLPYCDGDVSNLEGVHPFDRMLLKRQEQTPLPKSTFGVYGANHNFYNTEWQESDSFGCTGPGNTALFPQFGGSVAQRQTVVASLVPFMRAHVGRAARPELAMFFNPDRPLPERLARITPIDRGYTDTPDRDVILPIEDFSGPNGTGSSGLPTTARNISVNHGSLPSHDESQRAAAITWSGDGVGLFQTDLTAPGRGQSIAGFETIEFRVSRRCLEFCSRPHPLNGNGPTDFSIQLVRPNGSLSAPVRLARYLDLRGPVGAAFDPFGDYIELHPILQTARIPLRAFGLPPDSLIRGVRFTFDGSPTGAIYLANVRLSERSARLAAPARVAVASAAPAPEQVAAAATAPAAATLAAPAAMSAQIVAIRRAGAAAPAAASTAEVQAMASTPAIEIEIAADRTLPVTNSLPTIAIGDHRVQQSRFVGQGGTERLVFTLDAATFASLPDGEPIELRVGASRRMSLGQLDKSSLR
jgi:hypothetical protein